ncbi:hypothetical protein ACN47E_008895 [Coniothyrium glycines]
MTTKPEERNTFTFEHAELGSMTGLLLPDNVVQFRGVPFAHVPGRFKQSILLDALPHSNRDFTRLSYAAPQTFPDDAAGGGFFPGVTHPPPSHESACLNLQLNVPLACLQPPPQHRQLANLPLLVYIHGGGFVLGKIDEQHNTARMVEQSLRDAQPVLAASIQYRLGALGYLHTPEPGHANRALHDQRNALRWLQRFVRGFGGDEQRVTVFGESAGAISICGHMLGKVPESGALFSRAVLMSGVLGPMVGPVSVEEAEARYDEFLEVLGIEEKGVAGLERLRGLEVERIVDAAGVLNDRGSMWLSVREPGFFKEEVLELTWDQAPDALNDCSWVDEIILGTTGFEGTHQVARVAAITPSEFLQGIKEKMGEESKEVVSKEYDITPEMDQNLFVTQAMRWMGDVIFDAPTHAMAQSLTRKSNKKVYRYIFDVRNPFPNHDLYQQAHHWVDVYFVFKVHQFRYPSQRLKNISTKHAQLWITFANGKTPWSAYKYTGKGDEVIMVADEREGWVERTVAENEKVMEWSWRRCEKLWDSWKKESGKPFLPLRIAPLDGKKLT